jgi:hypothetical protein
VNRLDNVQDVGGNDDGIDQMHQNMANRLEDDDALQDTDDEEDLQNDNF